MVVVKRVYEPFSPDDGNRFLVERLWPRGIKKETLRMEGWLKDVAPSEVLRRWFGHDPKKWQEFRQRYFAELDGNLKPGIPCWRQRATARLRCSTAPGIQRTTTPSR